MAAESGNYIKLGSDGFIGLFLSMDEAREMSDWANWVTGYLGDFYQRDWVKRCMT